MAAATLATPRRVSSPVTARSNATLRTADRRKRSRGGGQKGRGRPEGKGWSRAEHGDGDSLDARLRRCFDAVEVLRLHRCRISR